MRYVDWKERERGKRRSRIVGKSTLNYHFGKEVQKCTQILYLSLSSSPSISSAQQHTHVHHAGAHARRFKNWTPNEMKNKMKKKINKCGEQQITNQMTSQCAVLLIAEQTYGFTNDRGALLEVFLFHSFGEFVLISSTFYRVIYGVSTYDRLPLVRLRRFVLFCFWLFFFVCSIVTDYHGLSIIIFNNNENDYQHFPFH